MNVRGQLLLLMTTYISLDNILVSAVCSPEKFYSRYTCPGARTAAGGFAELVGDGQLRIQVALTPQAMPYEPWRLRVQRVKEPLADALLVLARPCADLPDAADAVAAAAADADVFALCASTALLAARPGQRLWVWLEKLGRKDDLGCSFCEAMPFAVPVLEQEEQSTAPPPPPPLVCADLGAVAAVSAAAALLVVVVIAGLLCVVRARRVAVLRWLQKSQSAEEARRKCSSRRITERTVEVQNRPADPRQVLVEPPPPPPPPKAPSAPPATPSPPLSPTRGPLLVVPHFRPPAARPPPPLPPAAAARDALELTLEKQPNGPSTGN